MSRRLIFLFGGIAVVCGYLFLFEHNPFMMMPAGIAGMCVILVWVSQYQIDGWWNKRNPPKLDKAMQLMYTKSSKFYRNLSAEEKIEFGRRVALYIEPKDFLGMGQDHLAEDLKYIVAYYAILLTWGQEDFMFKHYGRVALYLHPFLTPAHPDKVHTYEIEHVDGTIILSIDQLAAGFLKSENYYQSGLHVFSELYLHYYTDNAFPELDANIWAKLEEISGLSLEKIETQTGVKQENAKAVTLMHFLTHTQKFAEVDSKLFDSLSAYLGFTSL